MRYLGIDMHKRDFTVCYRHSDEEYRFETFLNSSEGRDEFLKTISCTDEVAIESVSFGRHLAKLLTPKVKRLVHVHASANALVFQSIKKTDKNDAAALAFGLEKGILPESRFRSEVSHQLHRLLIARGYLIRMRITCTNFMNAIAATEGINIPVGKIQFRNWRDSVPIETFEFGDYRAWLEMNAQVESYRNSIRKLNKEIIHHSKLFDGYAVLESIPGFGPITVAELLAYIDGIEHFPNSKALCAYFGIVPRTRMSSGENIVPKKVSKYRAGAITRQGRKSARSAIVMSVNRTMVHNPSLRAFYDGIKGRKGYRKARTAAARKLLTFIYFALKKGDRISDFASVDFSRPHRCPTG